MLQWRRVMDKHSAWFEKNEPAQDRFEENQIEEQLDIEKMKLENNEAQAKERIRIAEEKIEVARGKKK